MNYWELRKRVARIVPRMTRLIDRKMKAQAVQEKGRKKNYQQFNIPLGEWRKQERLLNTEEINSFLEISARAAACPMPFNMDVWDGLLCPYNCLYCYANAFRASLYTAFFDNAKTMGYRHCNAQYYKTEIDKMLPYRSLNMGEKQKLSGINKAFSLDIPVRLGIRFEDFLNDEKENGVALELLNYMADIEYPVMINSKSVLPASDAYVSALSRNPAKTAIHITVISADNKVLKRLEPGAPSYDDRLKAMKTLSEAGVRVVARIEPYLFLLTDDREYVDKYIADMKWAGVNNITFDTYSYTALNPGIRQSIQNAGYDFDRMFTAGADSQPLGSILLGSFMQLFRDEGISCSTFDMGNAPSNDQTICCEVGDHFKGGYNYGSTVVATRFIQSRKGKPTHWKDFVEYVDEKGGFLSDELKRTVHELWNIGGNLAYSHRWAVHMIPTGMDEDGLIWRYDENTPDYRKTLEEELL